jgi:hypothetical protein
VAGISISYRSAALFLLALLCLATLRVDRIDLSSDHTGPSLCKPMVTRTSSARFIGSSATATAAATTTATASQQQSHSDSEDWVMMFSSSSDLIAVQNSASHSNRESSSTEWLSSRVEETAQDSFPIPITYPKSTPAEIAAFSFSNDAAIPVSALW